MSDDNNLEGATVDAGPLETLGDPIDDPELAAITRAALGEAAPPEPAPAGDAVEHTAPVDVSPDVAAAAVEAQLAPAVDVDLLPPDFDQVLAADDQLADQDLIGPVDGSDVFFLTHDLYGFSRYN